MRRYAILAIAALFVAVNANAVDMHGYFRNGVGGSSAGGEQKTFKNAGQDYKLRLGNEDNWSEFEFDQLLLKDKNGVEWSMGWMPGFGLGFNGPEDIASGNPATQQEFIRATFPQLSGATVWGGLRYYHRRANDIIDYFYMNESNAGAGIEDVDMGFAKLAVAVFHVVPKGAEGGEVQWMPDIRLEGIALNPGGTLEFALLAKIRHWNKHLNGEQDIPDKTQSFSPFVMIRHSQAGILNGGNNLAVTYKTGCFVSFNDNVKDITGTDPGIPRCHEDLKALTVSEDLTLNPSKQFSIILSGVYQNVQGPTGDGDKATLTSWYVGTRPLFKLADHFAIQGDLGYFYNKTDISGDKERTMIKGTIAPTITPFTDGFYGAHSAPEIRFFLTYASWNKEQRATTGNTFGAADEDVTSGMTFGTQVEAWF